MLVTANAMRLRKQWDLAEAKCSEALRRDPSNATAHSVMGDIMRDQGRLRDAVEWYKMALDRNPASVSDRRKLEDVIDRVFPHRPSETVHKVRSVFLRGLLTAVADVKAYRPSAALALVVVVMLGAILIVAISTTVMGRRAGTDFAARAGSGSGAFTAAEPASPPEGESLPASPAATAARSDMFGPDIAAREHALFAHVSARLAALDPNCRVVGAELDPLTGGASVRLSMPRLLSAEAMRSDILRIASLAAVSVAKWDNRVASVAIRCDMREPNGDEEAAFVAEVDSERLANTEAAEAMDPAQMLYPSWWHPSLRK